MVIGHRQNLALLTTLWRYMSFAKFCLPCWNGARCLRPVGDMEDRRTVLTSYPPAPRERQTIPSGQAEVELFVPRPSTRNLAYLPLSAAGRSSRYESHLMCDHLRQ